MNLKLRYSIIIVDLSLKNHKIQELPGALPHGPPPPPPTMLISRLMLIFHVLTYLNTENFLRSFTQITTDNRKKNVYKAMPTPNNMI